MESKESYTPEEVGKLVARSYMLGVLVSVDRPDASLLEKITDVVIPENVRQHATDMLYKATDSFSESIPVAKPVRALERQNVKPAFDKERAKQVRLDRGLSLDDLAKIVGFKKGTSIYTYECGGIPGTRSPRSAHKNFDKYVTWLNEHGYSSENSGEKK